MVFRLAALALAVAFAPPAHGFDISKLDSGIIRQFRQAWHLSERGNSNQEVVVLIVREPDGTYEAELKQDRSGFQTVTFQFHPQVVAIFHTHPNRTPMQPSPQDIRNSDQLQVPNFTLTNRGMWVYDPITKKTSLVMPFLSWLRLENWRRIRDGV